MAQYYNNAISEKLNQEKLSVGWPWRLFSFSFLVILASGVIYFGLAFGYKNFLNDRISNIDSEIQQLSESIPQEQQDKLIKFYRQLANLQGLLNKHITSSNIFPVLEKNTNEGVFYNSAELKTVDRRLALEGVANSYQVLSQQLEAFNRLPDVEKVIVNESYLSGGRVAFRLFIILNEKIFTKNN